MENIKNKVMALNSTLWEKFEYCMMEFTQDTDNLYSNAQFFSGNVRSMDVEYTQPYMVFLVLTKLKNFEYEYQPMEKVLYEIPFKYKDHYSFFSMGKFGLKFGINTDSEEVIQHLFKKLNRAIKITNRLLSPIVEETVNNGNFTLENKSGILRSRYLYFRNNAQSSLEYDHEKSVNDISALVSMMNNRSKKEWEALYNIQAMLDAYFSFQEHILILLLPFSQFNKHEDNITVIIGSDWTAKFNRIFKPQQNPTVMKHYENLREIKELRNKYSHGGFDKKNKSLFAHIQDVGAVPVELPQRKEGNEFKYSVLSINDINFSEICRVINEFDQYLQTSEWSRAIQILEAGIDIRYDQDFIDQLHDAIQSDENLESFLQFESDMYARNANMDW